MNPRVVAMQNGFLLLALTGLVLLGSRDLAVGIALGLLLYSVGMAYRYGKTRSRTAPYAQLTGPEWKRPGRRSGEILVGGSTVIATIAPTVLAVAEIIAQGEVVNSPSRVASSVLLVPVALLLAVVVGSSLVDWWFIHPRIDGLVCRPPCMEPGYDRWRGVTQIWLVHRWIAAGAVILGVGLVLYGILGIALYVGVDRALSAALNEDERKTLALVTAVIGGGLVLEATRRLTGVLDAVAGDYIQNLKIVTRLALNPSVALGDYVLVRAGQLDKEGYLLDVSFEGMTVVPRSLIIDGKSRDSAFVGDLVRTDQIGTAHEVAQSRHTSPRCDEQRCFGMNERYCFRAQNLRSVRQPKTS